MRVSELMSPNVVTIGMADSCLEAVRRMTHARVRHLPVVDGQGGLVGIVTDRDLRHRLFRPAVFREIGKVRVEALLAAAPVKDIMSAPVVTAGLNDELEAAARLMLEDKVGSLPVVEGGRVVGILTETDLLRRIVEADAGPDVECIVVSYP